MTSRTGSVSGWYAVLLISIMLALSGCGGGSSASSGGGGSTPPSTPSTANEWTWMGGSSTVPATYEGQPGVYGTLGVAASSNVPGSRNGAVRWTDSSGNFWLFGGAGFDSNGTEGQLNDLWEFSPSAKTWTWVSGSSTVGATGVYGTKGTGSTTNVPGARAGSVSWIDGGGNLWLFGGNWSGEELNDLWEFSPVNKEWTWVSGSMATAGSGLGAVGVYGTQGVASASNVPGGRWFAAAWIDSSGNLWLFGGDGIDSTGAFGTLGFLNDLWEFNPSTKEWTWVNGSSAGNVVPVYGAQGTASTSNTPGGRDTSASWNDSTGNLWLFGGFAGDSATYSGALNDVWEFNPSAKTWTWVSGSSTVNAVGNYGTQGVASANNVPQARWGAVSWTDSSGDMWCFGGEAYDSTGSAYLNDLWKYTPANNQWTWMGGSSAANAKGVYGTLDTPAATNTPGGHFESVSWTDTSGNFWLFGGGGYDSTGTNGILNDLWRYQP